MTTSALPPQQLVGESAGPDLAQEACTRGGHAGETDVERRLRFAETGTYDIVAEVFTSCDDYYEGFAQQELKRVVVAGPDELAARLSAAVRLGRAAVIEYRGGVTRRVSVRARPGSARTPPVVVRDRP